MKANAPRFPRRLRRTSPHAQACRFGLITQAFFCSCEKAVTMSGTLFSALEHRAALKRRNKAVSDLCYICILGIKRNGFVKSFIDIATMAQALRSMAPRCMVYYIESRCSLKKHCDLKVFNWRLHFKTASPAAGFILIASSNALNEASGEECG